MKKCFLLLPMLALLVTGCPRNEYTVKLTPRGDKLERELVFYRADGQDSNGVPKYEPFSEDELGAIKALYPKDGVTRNGGGYVAKGQFASAMPADVGGAGAYTNLTTSMGSAGFYGERFRGNDDIAGLAEKRLAAANQLVDIVVGWSQAELGAETNYAQLRQFLDSDFRQDVKNAAFYWKQAITEAQSRTNAVEEYQVRFAQFLMERGYFKMSDVPDLFRMLEDDDDKRFNGFIQRLVARKLGVPDSQPVPGSLAFLGDSDTVQKSFEKYFMATELYRAKIKEWEKKQQPPENKPKAQEMVMDQIEDILGFQFFGDPEDHLTVKLSLSGPPAHTNGKWDETNKVVVWDSDLENKTNSVQLPVICYASWGHADESFQKQHFSRVILAGDDLVAYCLWRASLNDKQGAEWEQLLAALQPGEKSKQKVKDFRFSDELPISNHDEPQKSPSYSGRMAIDDTLEDKAENTK